MSAHNICFLGEIRKISTWYRHISRPMHQSSLSVWRDIASLAIQNVNSEDSDQAAQMRRLIWIFTRHMSPKVQFLTLQPVWPFYHLFFFPVGLSNVCFMPPPLELWNLMDWAVSATQGESNCVVSWSTRWVYLVLPERPKFFTWRLQKEHLLSAG